MEINAFCYEDSKLISKLETKLAKAEERFERLLSTVEYLKVRWGDGRDDAAPPLMLLDFVEEIKELEQKCEALSGDESRMSLLATRCGARTVADQLHQERDTALAEVRRLREALVWLLKLNKLGTGVGLNAGVVEKLHAALEPEKDDDQT